jgi:Flp pilus assembly protein TadD
MVRAIRLGAHTSSLVAMFALACWGVSSSAAAQALPSVSQPVVQPLPRRDGLDLNAALGRLARDPRDIDALVDAGNAALMMGDIEAATGFFRRADQVSPSNPRVKAGLAGAMVHNGDPFSAIALFEEAEKAGAMDSALAADRGLAHDLVGDNASAQRYYRQSLARKPNDEVVRRLALSLAISGDKQSAEQTISPLLHQRNLAAWRTRAFSLAILGQTEEAVKVADSILPADLAASIAPYLRYMPRLTPAQQAAAANFGAFPRASEIGRDDPRIAQFAPRRAEVAQSDAALVPQGQPLGRNARDRKRASRTQIAASDSRGNAARVAPRDPQPARAAATEPDPQVAATPIPARSEPALAASSPERPSPAATSASPGFSLPPKASTLVLPAAATNPPPVPAAPASQVAAAPQTVTPRPTTAAAPAQPATPSPMPRSLREAFAEFTRPSIDVTPAAGAVDLRQIKPPRPEVKKTAEPVKPPPPSHPSRIWVQVATGRDKAALGFDWRRMIRAQAEIFRGKQAFISVWGQTNRLLTGPFQSETAANAFIAQLRGADVDGPFIWTSPAGQVVDALAADASARR